MAAHVRSRNEGTGIRCLRKIRKFSPMAVDEFSVASPTVANPSRLKIEISLYEKEAGTIKLKRTSLPYPP